MSSLPGQGASHDYLLRPLKIEKPGEPPFLFSPQPLTPFSPHSREVIRAKARRRTVLELKRSGLTVAEIARRIQRCPGRVYQLIRQAQYEEDHIRYQLSLLDPRFLPVTWTPELQVLDPYMPNQGDL